MSDHSRRLSRRAMLRVGGTVATAVGLGVLHTSTASSTESSPGAHTSRRQEADDCQEFDEIYRGRHIVGRCAHGCGARRQAHAESAGEPDVRVFIDGEELYVMGNADGSFVSIINHFEPQPTPLAVARVAADGLAGAALIPTPSQPN